MALTEKEVRHVAMLGRLALSDEEIHAFTSQLGALLQYIDKLQQVDTSKVEPMITATAGENVFRADEPRPSLPRGEALKSAPDHDDEYFRVPKVIE